MNSHIARNQTIREETAEMNPLGRNGLPADMAGPAGGAMAQGGRRDREGADAALQEEDREGRRVHQADQVARRRCRERHQAELLD